MKPWLGGVALSWMIIVKGLPCPSVPILVEENGVIDVSSLLGSGVPGNEGVKLP